MRNNAEVKQASPDDPRITRLGRFIRRTNIDELPQFINVLKGDMSVVGPRPHPLWLNEKFSAVICDYGRRHEVKPGITGLAQVNGFRGETRQVEDMEGRVGMDISYIESWTFGLDLRIVLRTIGNMFRGERNAY
jgi:putative colanic acid biosynthesis UDP-glucose lipid carrier transferase